MNNFPASLNKFDTYKHIVYGSETAKQILKSFAPVQGQPAVVYYKDSSLDTSIYGIFAIGGPDTSTLLIFDTQNLSMTRYRTAAEQDIIDAGKQNIISESNKIDAEFVNDAYAVNKFVTVADKNNWNAKIDNPLDGSVGQVLKKTATGVEWSNESPSGVIPRITTEPLYSIYLPNTHYILDWTSGGDKTIILGSTTAGIRNEWIICFNTGDLIPNITWPTVSWDGDVTPQIKASKHYEISICEGYGCYKEFTILTSGQ